MSTLQRSPSKGIVKKFGPTTRSAKQGKNVLALALVIGGVLGAATLIAAPGLPEVAQNALREATSTPQERFFHVAREAGETRGATDSDLLAIGYAVCQSQAQHGSSAATMGGMTGLEEVGFDTLDAGLVVGSALTHLCPQN